MQELEKILEEMKESSIMVATSKEHYIHPQDGRFVEEVVLLNDVEEIIRKHMNDGWISVEDRLPEESGNYRVTVKNKELGDIIEETAWFAHVDDYDIDESEWREIYEFEEVIAWRELEPYRPERSNK